MRFAKARRRSISANDHLISPDQRDNGGGENSRSIPTMTRTIRQVYTHPVSDFFTGGSRLRRQFRYDKA